MNIFLKWLKRSLIFICTLSCLLVTFANTWEGSNTFDKVRLNIQENTNKEYKYRSNILKDKKGELIGVETIEE